MLTTNTLLLERKQSLRKKMEIVFSENPEMTDAMMDFLDALTDFSDALIAQLHDEAQRTQNKHELREDLSK